MLSQGVAIPGHQRTTRPASGLKAFLLTCLTAAVLLLGTDLAIAGAVTAVLGVAAGGFGVAYDSCQRVETHLADDLGLDSDALRAADRAALTNRVAARRDAGTLTAFTGNRASERVNAYIGCRPLFLNPAPAR